uniref:ATP synthase F0 subunit 8 n=1 Tax=Multinervis guangxiensis TaxID=1792637 RepID=UPI003001A604|nr:ATP synthase F0 subunit 8 [Multinervis guangxiensis]
MPQMAPMWWTTMLLMNLCLILMLMSIIYFYSEAMKSKFKSSKKLKFNWKW